MRAGVAFVVLVGCSSPPPPPKAPMVNTVIDQRAAETHRWREAMVNATIAALAAGDTEALVALSDPASAFEQVADCEHRRRDELGKAAAKAKGLKLEVVSIVLEQPSHESERGHVERGASFRGCVAKSRLIVHDIDVKVRVDHDGRQHRKKARIQLVETAGRYYLARAPDNLDGGSSGSEALARMREFTDRMCQCKDRTCADGVQEDMVKWGTEAAKTAERDERPDPEMVKYASEIMTRYTECMTKLLMSSTP
jgi:hypothetical protein